MSTFALEILDLVMTGSGGRPLSVIGYRLSVIGYRLSVIGFRLSVFSDQYFAENRSPKTQNLLPHFPTSPNRKG
jgi:hypothetical protein